MMTTQQTGLRGNTQSLKFFDCNCIVGKRADRKEGEPWSLNSLLEDMEYFGISESLVVHALSKDYDPLSGNKELIGTIAGHANLHPVWTIVSSMTPEIPSPKAFVEDAGKYGVKAFTAFPKFHGFSLATWCSGGILAEIQNIGAPLLLPFSETSWDEVHSICSAFPQLPVIVHTVNYRQLRFLLPLWINHRNLFVDLSWFSIVDIIPFLVENKYLDRLLFGTNYPSYTPGAAVTMVTYSNVGLDFKQKIAGDNLRGILQNINYRKI